MFDKLVDLFIQFIRLFQFVTVVPCYSDGVILRFGGFNRMAKRGQLNWIWPFGVEEVVSTNVVPETMPVGPQSLTTRDGRSVVISTVITFSIVDVKVFLLSIEGAGQVIEDSTYGIVADFIMEHTWQNLRDEKMMLANELTKEVRRAAKKYGVYVNTVQIADFTLSRSYRLMQPLHGHFAPTHRT